MLTQLIFDSNVNGHHIPLEQRILIFEDFDAQSVQLTITLPPDYPQVACRVKLAAPKLREKLKSQSNTKQPELVYM